MYDFGSCKVCRPAVICSTNGGLDLLKLLGFFLDIFYLDWRQNNYKLYIGVYSGGGVVLLNA